MGEKLKVNYETYEALNGIQRLGVESILQNHYVAKYGNFPWVGYEEPLNKLSLEEMATAVINGYALCETPADKFNRMYLKYINSTIQFEQDFANGMKYTAELFGLDVSTPDREQVEGCVKCK